MACSAAWLFGPGTAARTKMKHIRRKQLAILIMNAVKARSAAVPAGPAAAQSKGCSARATRQAFGSSDALRLVLGAHSRAPGTRGRAIMRIAGQQLCSQS